MFAVRGAGVGIAKKLLGGDAGQQSRAEGLNKLPITVELNDVGAVSGTPPKTQIPLCCCQLNCDLGGVFCPDIAIVVGSGVARIREVEIGDASAAEVVKALRPWISNRAYLDAIKDDVLCV